MSPLRRCLAELRDLFIERERFTVLVIAWIAIACLVLPSLGAGSPLAPWSGPILFAGIAILLAATL